MVLLALDREALVQWCAAIQTFLRERLQLELRPELTAPLPVGQSIDCVGWRTWWNRRRPRRRTLGNLRIRLEHFERTAVRPMWDGSARRSDLRRQDTAGSVERQNFDHGGRIVESAGRSWRIPFAIVEADPDLTDEADGGEQRERRIDGADDPLAA